MEVKLMEENIEELNFLRGELKKINDQIKELKYDQSDLGLQTRLWEWKEKIEGKIKNYTKPHQAVKSKSKKRKGGFMTA
jgi:hypothetical protein